VCLRGAKARGQALQLKCAQRSVHHWDSASQWRVAKASLRLLWPGLELKRTAHQFRLCPLKLKLTQGGAGGEPKAFASVS